MPLEVIVAGAGIAGLCTAVALRQQGHIVTVFEKSKFATETGAAIALSPNGVRVLQSLRFSFEKARAQKQEVWESFDGTTLERLSYSNTTDASEKFGAAFMAIHRVDLHTELLRLALDGNEQKPVELYLSSRIINVQHEHGTVELDNGSLHHADLILAADGVHSIIREVVLRDEQVSASEAAPAGMSAFRFLIPTSNLKAHAVYERTSSWKAERGVTVMADTQDPSFKDRHIVWYQCQNGEVQNLVGIQPTRNIIEQQDTKSAMLKEFSHFHPDILGILSLAEDVKLWPLSIHKPLKRWTYGKVLLIGDAAHPMLPFGGQGSNQAMEDGGALGVLLSGIDDTEDVPKRLTMFENVRRDRASRVQILSKVRIGTEARVKHEVEEYSKPGITVPTSFPTRQIHDAGFDVLAACYEALASGGSS